MQDEVNTKVVAIAIKGGKITGELLDKALKKFIEEIEKAQKTASQPKTYRGKQSIKHLVEQNAAISNIEVTDGTLGDRKTALFVIISDTDDTFNFVVAIMYSQLFNLLCDKADDVYNGRLPVHVRCLLDEFANIGQIPKFDKLIATIRSREISASIILQSQSQLKTIYKDAADIEGWRDIQGAERRRLHPRGGNA